ncbi:hypothetical protein DAPPUDRAFT_119038 [Daphnia pulex]|uniref:Vitellogenin domain-containing protein n=1 Tax=Daphnia pulex TaxID=6669 RepID=E9HXA0_DAPPU|nr:hypothetical protein DAPPUDRAFT_119038 [Daphnia pulex]|eukprot:EFX63632.1 hypothetical protein DAPPUDRAFT_119038 [Daphnia pulex]
MQNILAIILVSLAVCCNCQSNNPVASSSSWAKLRISPDTFSFMEYGNFVVRIYEHANNHVAATTASQKRYFYSPLALLDHSSAVSSYNGLTKQPEMLFRIVMWSNKVENEVVQHLSGITGHPIKSYQVSVIPLENLILISGSPPVDFWLNPWWTYYDGRKTRWLSLSCYEQKVCDRLANAMRWDPTQFAHFKLLYSFSSHQTWQTKQATISIDSVTSGQLVSTLLKKFKKKKKILLTANDEMKMLKETTKQVLRNTFSEFEVWSPYTEVEILNILKGLLVTSRTTIKEQSDKMWHSVFWDDDNYRPDKTAKTLNEIYNKLDKETQKIFIDIMFQTEEHLEFSSSRADVDGISSIISGKMATNSDSSRRVDISIEEMVKLLTDSRNRDHVQWDGAKFVPKPIQLSRINLAKCRNFQPFQDRKVSVRYTIADLSASIKFVEREGLKITDELKGISLKNDLIAR